MHQTNPSWLITQAPQDLNGQIRIAVQYGYHVTSQTDKTVQLFRYKKFSIWFALLWLFAFGVGLLVYVLYYAVKRDDAIYLDLDTQPTGAELYSLSKSSGWKGFSTRKKALYIALSALGICVLSMMFRPANSFDAGGSVTSTKEIISTTTIKTLLEAELVSIKGFDGEAMRKLQKEHKQSPELEVFERWGALVEEGKKSADQQTMTLAKVLEKEASAIQSKEFPLMRKLTAEQFKDVLWVKDTDVRVSGTRNDSLEFVSVTFARNKNILDFYSPISESLKRLRFRSVDFRWSDGADGTRFNHAKDTDFPKDGDVVPRAQ